MSPQVVAAIIAASVSFLTLVGTLAAQFFGRRATSRDTEKTLAEQGRHLDRTLAEQREQLNRTLAEQREQLNRTLAEQRSRAFNERFATAAGQLGSDKPAAVRLAGVYAMAGLADDWLEKRQTCVDVLCAYLRMPYEPDPGEQAPKPEQLAFRASREVRHTVIRVITTHLQSDDRRPVTAQDWRGLDLDFTGTVFDGGTFAGAEFSSGRVNFTNARFSGGTVNFVKARFSGGDVRFDQAEFSGGAVDFGNARFSGGRVSFTYALFSRGDVSFAAALFSGTTVGFGGARFSGGRVSFTYALFSRGDVIFNQAGFFGGEVDFPYARFSGCRVDFGVARFSGGTVNFHRAAFTDGTVNLMYAKFSGATVDFSNPDDWSVPPVFAWPGAPPPGVTLPDEEDQSQAEQA